MSARDLLAILPPDGGWVRLCDVAALWGTRPRGSLAFAMKECVAGGLVQWAPIWEGAQHGCPRVGVRRTGAARPPTGVTSRPDARSHSGSESPRPSEALNSAESVVPVSSAEPAVPPHRVPNPFAAFGRRKEKEPDLDGPHREDARHTHHREEAPVGPHGHRDSDGGEEPAEQQVVDAPVSPDAATVDAMCLTLPSAYSNDTPLTAEEKKRAAKVARRRRRRLARKQDLRTAKQAAAASAAASGHLGDSDDSCDESRGDEEECVPNPFAAFGHRKESPPPVVPVRTASGPAVAYRRPARTFSDSDDDEYDAIRPLAKKGARPSDGATGHLALGAQSLPRPPTHSPLPRRTIDTAEPQSPPLPLGPLPLPLPLPPPLPPPLPLPLRHPHLRPFPRFTKSLHQPGSARMDALLPLQLARRGGWAPDLRQPLQARRQPVPAPHGGFVGGPPHGHVATPAPSSAASSASSWDDASTVRLAPDTDDDEYDLIV